MRTLVNSPRELLFSARLYHAVHIKRMRGRTNTSSYRRPFAASHSRGTKPSCEKVKVALGQDKQRKLPFTCKIMYVFCSSCPSAFALRRGDFVPRQWQAAKGLKDLAGSSPRILANEGPGHGPRPDV